MAMDTFNDLIARTRADYNREVPYTAQDAEDRLAWIGAKYLVALVATLNDIARELHCSEARGGYTFDECPNYQCTQVRSLFVAIERDAKGEC